ncbi:hypothetical protein LTR09_012283 [Extremus antarcticus]|uniref:GST C-terminal domain-containing protein n=1 Tax=Extremus antarcticus TaxID=702011 RepID=A0AAJ0DAM4_9PEZI|nr:hypothetical protein LTR09_012283 [Extremus antarcticus]
MLALNDGSGMIVKQSIAILEYFEELYAADTEAGKYPSPLIGRTTQERAKVRQLLLIAEEVIDAFGYTYRFGSIGEAMSGRSTPNPLAARQAVSVIHEKLDILESYVDPVKENGSAMLVHLEHPKDYLFLADCVLFASLQYLKDQYEIEMIEEKYERLRLWYEEMSKRESAVVEGEYSEELKQIGREWIESGNFWTEINKAV